MGKHRWPRYDPIMCPKCNVGVMMPDHTRINEMSQELPIPRICNKCGYHSFFDMSGQELPTPWQKPPDKSGGKP